MGGITAIFMSAIFPEIVQKLICVDTVNQTSLSAAKMPSNMRNVLSQFHGISEKMAKGLPNRRVTYKEAREKLILNYNNSLDEKAADILLIRGLRKVGDDLYEQTRDLRSIIVPFISEEELEAAIQSVDCPFLYIKAKDSVIHKIDDFAQFYKRVYARHSAPGFCHIEVDGDHHVHLTHPERIAPHINSFLAS